MADKDKQPQQADFDKAFENMKYALPKTLEHFSKEGFQFKAINIWFLGY